MVKDPKFTVVVADAEPVARLGLCCLINQQKYLRVCAEAESVRAARELCERHQPSILLLDAAMTDGFTLVKDLPRWSAKTRVVVFTGLAEPVAVQRALKAGAYGYVTRGDATAAVLAVIEAACEGRRQIGPQVQRLLLETMASGTVEMHANDVQMLSDRELEVFRRIGRGLGTREIADELKLSVKTVESHRQRIKVKLNLATGVELQRRAVLFASQDVLS